MKNIMVFLVILYLVSGSALARKRPVVPVPTPLPAAVEKAPVLTANQQYDKAYAEGRKDFVNGAYENALEKFLMAESLKEQFFLLQPADDLHLAIGLCYEMLRQYKKAAEYFQMVATSETASQPVRDEATCRLHDINQQNVVDSYAFPTPKAQASPPHYVRTAAYITLPASIALGVAGSVMMGLAWSQRNALVGKLPTDYNSSTLGDAKGEFTLGAGLLGTGAVIVSVDLALIVCSFVAPERCR